MNFFPTMLNDIKSGMVKVATLLGYGLYSGGINEERNSLPAFFISSQVLICANVFFSVCQDRVLYKEIVSRIPLMKSQDASNIKICSF